MSIDLFRSRTEFILLLKLNSLLLLSFFASSLKRLWNFVVFWIECCYSDYSCLTSFIFLNNLDDSSAPIYDTQNNDYFFHFYFGMRALVARLRVKMTIWFIILFKFIKMTNFIKLLILVELIIKKFVILMLIIVVVIIFARAT